MIFPEDSIQSAIAPSPWWEETNNKTIERGSLIRAFVPYPDQMPHKFILKGRMKAEEHGSAKIEISALRITETNKESNLPVAAMILPKGELWTAYRAKRRPCLVLGVNKLYVEKTLIHGKPKWQTAPVILAVPYYGADEGYNRAGFRPALLEKIKHATYPQLFLDKLPLPGSDFSVLRLDHVQPIGSHYNAYERTGYRLSEDALAVMDEWLDWYIYDQILENGIILDFQMAIEETAP